MHNVAQATKNARTADSSVMEATFRWLRSTRALMLAIACLGLALTLYQLGTPSLWMDESYSVELARRPLSTLWLAYSSGGEANMVLYHVLLHLWLKVLSLIGIPSLEFAVRLPSALFTTASAVVVCALGRKYVSQLAGGLAAVLFLLNPFVLTAAQQTRAYSLQLLLVTLSWYALLNALTGVRRVSIWWVGYALVTGAGLYTQLSTVFIVGAQIMFLALVALVPTPWRAHVRTRGWAAILSLLAIGVLFTPIALTSQGASKTGWLSRPALRDLRALYLVYAFGNAHWTQIFGLLLCGAAGILGLILFFIGSYRVAGNRFHRGIESTRRSLSSDILRRPTTMETLFLLVLLCWLVIPVLAMFVVSQGTTRVFSTRYLVIIVPALVLLISTVAAVLRIWLLRVAVISAFLIPAVVGAVSYYPAAQVEDWRTPTRWLEQYYQSGDGVVSYNNVQGAQFSIQYYLHSDGSEADFDADSPGVVLWERLPQVDPFAHYQDALDTQSLSRYAALHHRFFFIAGRLADPDDVAKVQATINWLNSHYHLLGHSANGAATVMLYSAP
jgi:uncharacterized membrane protein